MILQFRGKPDPGHGPEPSPAESYHLHRMIVWAAVGLRRHDLEAEALARWGEHEQDRRSDP